MAECRTRSANGDSETEKSFVYESPMGPLLITASNTHVTRLRFMFGLDGEKEAEKNLPESIGKQQLKSCPALCSCVRWLDSYFSLDCSKPPAPPPKIRLPKMTKFRHKVIHSLMDTEVGDTLTYTELSARAGSSGAAQAVGTALHLHGLPLLIPCHRVVRSPFGKPTAWIGKYSGGLGGPTKQWLLDHETKKQKRRNLLQQQSAAVVDDDDEQADSSGDTE